MYKLYVDGEYTLVWDGDSDSFFVLDRDRNIKDICGEFPKRFARYFPSLADHRRMHVLQRRLRDAVSDYRRPKRCFEDAVGIPY